MEPYWIHWPETRIRRELNTGRTFIRSFVYQLEYDIEAKHTQRHKSDWQTVARFDHDIEGPHDVYEEGLHLDIYRYGEKENVVTDFPPIEVKRAPRFCEEFLDQNATFLLGRFERWHGIRGRWRAQSSE